MAQSAHIAVADFSTPMRVVAMADVRRLITNADLFEDVGDKYCLEFEKRAEAALVRLETIQ
jgi:hypothetical protein